MTIVKNHYDIVKNHYDINNLFGVSRENAPCWAACRHLS